jgi:hypothetical protein
MRLVCHRLGVYESLLKITRDEMRLERIDGGPLQAKHQAERVIHPRRELAQPIYDTGRRRTL